MNASWFWERLGFLSKPESGLATRIQAQVLSDIGCDREMNEDSACCIHPADIALLHNKGVLAIVADGMGGHPSGELASKIATDAITKTYYDSPYEAQRALREAIAAANSAIRDAATINEESKGMGATCTAIALLPHAAVFGHIGDTRLYLVRDGRIRQLTEDQTRVMRMIKQGLLSKENARKHEDRNIVLEALGQRPSTEGAQWGTANPTRIGDQFVLCSDGLHDLIRDDEIRDHILRCKPEIVCQELVALAKSRGGYDNITVVVLRIVAAGNTESKCSDTVGEAPHVAKDH